MVAFYGAQVAWVAKVGREGEPEVVEPADGLGGGAWGAGAVARVRVPSKRRESFIVPALPGCQ